MVYLLSPEVLCLYFVAHSVGAVAIVVTALIRYGAPNLLAAYAIRCRQPVKIKAGRFEFENLPDKEPREPPKPGMIRKFPEDGSGDKRRAS